jgi:hypothetical protein
MDKPDLVSDMLKNFPKTRDDDFLLILRVWLVELGSNASVETKKCFKFLLDAYHTKQISNFETIRRRRQKLQEENPGLRGDKYYSRQAQGELFRQEIVK